MATPPERVTLTTVRDVANNPDALHQLRDGLANAWTYAHDAEIEALYDELEAVLASEDVAGHPCLMAYDAMVNEAVAEIVPAVARMLEQAIAKRLPWTWERAER